ncbi:MAG: hypothetical protein HYV93_08925 [Candidatus Rokubacteria bacterium]|nr:hypothetical protein [Candidatus Rokubacteria bacterium]
MEWGGAVVASLVVLVLLGPLVVMVAGALLLTVFAQFLPASPSVARTSFDCPFSHRRVDAAFLSWPGAEYPADVVSCSAFLEPARIRCKKGCLALAHTASVGTPVVPRFSLVADGVAYRT